MSLQKVQVEQKVLNENQRLAAELRERFRQSGTLVLNLISAPGSGKTSLLERTLASLSREVRTAVLTGDIQTENDARRLSA
ncbi:MAG TPA: GTP-binding protein, partial [Terriglobales bacterium]